MKRLTDYYVDPIAEDRASAKRFRVTVLACIAIGASLGACLAMLGVM